MRENFTPDFLIRFLYKECSASDSAAFKASLEKDAQLKKEYLSLRKAYRELPKVQFRPSDDVVSKVLNYSTIGLLESA